MNLEAGFQRLHAILGRPSSASRPTPPRAVVRARVAEATGKEEVGMNPQLEPLKPIASDPPGGSSDVGDVSWVAPTCISTWRPRRRACRGTRGRWSPAAACRSGTRA
jgi:hypothetical protein